MYDVGIGRHMREYLVMRKLLERCPACEEELIVTEHTCLHCDTIIRGQFQPNIFSRLSPNNLKFLEVFVRNRGNVKEMERELGWSYWTIRNHLNEIIAALGFEEAEADAEFQDRERQDILERLDKGELNASEAADLLAKLKES
jgi:hypothetical protein